MKSPNRIDFVDNAPVLHIESRTYGDMAVLISAQDVDRVRTRTWRVAYRNKFYVESGTRALGTHMFLHRFVLEAPEAFYVDHINGNTLDNRRDNLRLVTHQENLWNMPGAKGYSWVETSKRWDARIRVNGRLKRLGSFKTEDEARAAYLKAKAEVHVIPNRRTACSSREPSP